MHIILAILNYSLPKLNPYIRTNLRVDRLERLIFLCDSANFKGSFLLPSH